MDTVPQVFLTFLLTYFFILLGRGEGAGHGSKELVLLVSSTQLETPGWKPGNNTYLLSPNGTFVAGFYNVSSNNYAFSVWYANDPHRTLAWMANRDALVGDNSSLTLKNGTLTISDSDARVVWSQTIPTSKLQAGAVMDMVLLESGNLVFNTSNQSNYVWQSFDFPTFTLLPTQNFSASKNNTLVSTRNDSTYASGLYIFSAAFQSNTKTPSLYYKRSELAPSDQLDLYWAWTVNNQPDSLGVDGHLSLDDDGNLTTPSNPNSLKASDSGEIPKPLRRLTLDHDGNLRIYSWKGDSSSTWEVVWEAVLERCQIHGTCGDNAICKTPDLNDSTPECQCPPGFHPDVSTDPPSCQINIQFSQPLCSSNYQSIDYHFIPLDYVHFTGEGRIQTNSNFMKLEECRSACLNICTCLGFSAKLDGSGYCFHYFSRLLNGYWSPESQGSRTYLKLSRAETNVSNPYTGMLSVAENVCEAAWSLPFPPNNSDHTKRNLIIICSIFGIELFCGVLAFWAFLRQHAKYRDITGIFSLDILLNLSGGGPKRFAYAELKAATNNFRDEVGRGGFGTVYKGVLPDQRQIAVKKLKGVSQGEGQFWAEVTIIGRIHHLNLVRMWGFCTEGEHRLLVYEYIPNGSLEKHLFNNPQGNTVGLEWSTRYRIAVGVARAISYLHEECLEWVLHRDIKPENILLDESFCPKISDFGLAKLVDRERSPNVSNIEGTPGYLAPEYWMQNNEPITAKVDVYSFGIVLLQIVSRRKNLWSSQSRVEGDEWFFPMKAFEWVVLERNVEAVVDKSIVNGVRDDRLQMEGIERMVKTAFWCIQSRPDERPSMGKVAKMLQGTLEVPHPPKPDFFVNFFHADSSLYADHMQELDPSVQEVTGTEKLEDDDM